MGQVQHHAAQCIDEPGVGCANTDARRPGGRANQAVRGGGIAVHGDAVECQIGGGADHVLKN